jgi:hypothetical protein
MLWRRQLRLGLAVSRSLVSFRNLVRCFLGGWPYPVNLFSNREFACYSLSKTVVDFLRQGNVIRAIPVPPAVVELEYLVDLIAIAVFIKLTLCRRVASC